MRSLLVVLLCIASTSLFAQQKTSSPPEVNFFNEDTLLDVTLITDMRKMINDKFKEANSQPANFICRKPDSSILINAQIQIQARGNSRKKLCYFPPLKLSFKETATEKARMSSLKMVCQCNPSSYFEQLLLKEYLTYKIWNLLSEKSFRVRLLHIVYKDSDEKKKDFDQYAFLIEDAKELGKRIGCREMKKVRMNTEATDRAHMTNVAIFQYMIGNTDWGIPVLHNIALLQPKADSSARPFAIPYDFDYSGLVNAEYAIPDPKLNIDNVRQRIYRGFPRTIEELNATLAIYNQQKEKIYALVNNFELLTSKNREAIIDYLDDFYKDINNQDEVKYIFIDGARTE